MKLTLVESLVDKKIPQEKLQEVAKLLGVLKDDYAKLEHEVTALSLEFDDETILDLSASVYGLGRVLERIKVDAPKVEACDEKSCEGKMCESRLNLKEAKEDSREDLGSFKFNGEDYHIEGIKSHTKDYHWEEVFIRKGFNDVVGYGKDKWMNRPWYKFTFGNALRVALIDLLGKDKKEEILNAINSSRDCQEVVDKLFKD